MSTTATKRGRVAAMHRHHPDEPQTVAIAAEYKEDKAAEYIRSLVEDAPTLSREQLDRLALLLRGAGA